ncbi:unnamed protein product [Cylicocyclus nassatus]|uniref:Uncharacterized protein n=1 Tax=Cylicocyclus nassatus TaxID=53992 RepID=A0AA36GX43_CYLNA|nr:unnamed protein product [Cylicocyclus nassatus]
MESRILPGIDGQQIIEGFKNICQDLGSLNYITDPLDVLFTRIHYLITRGATKGYHTPTPMYSRYYWHDRVPSKFNLARTLARDVNHDVEFCKIILSSEWRRVACKTYMEYSWFWGRYYDYFCCAFNEYAHEIVV